VYAGAVGCNLRTERDAAQMRTHLAHQPHELQINKMNTTVSAAMQSVSVSVFCCIGRRTDQTHLAHDKCRAHYMCMYHMPTQRVCVFRMILRENNHHFFKHGVFSVRYELNELEAAEGESLVTKRRQARGLPVR
jgi:hypothetical protein